MREPRLRKRQEVRFKRLRLNVIALAIASILLASGCSGTSNQVPTDPSGIALKAFCGADDALANNKADWSIMGAADSEIEDALAAADRLERSYVLNSESLALVPTSNPVFQSAQYIKGFSDKLVTIFQQFKRGFIFESQSDVDAAMAQYTSVYNEMNAALTSGSIPGAEAFSAIVGNMGTTCVGVTTSYAPADSSTAVNSPENVLACQADLGGYSVNQLFLDLRGLDPSSFTDGNLAALEPLKEFATKLQPVLVNSSGPLLVGLAKMSSGLITLYEAGRSNSTSLLPSAEVALSEGIALAGQACKDIGIVFRE